MKPPASIGDIYQSSKDMPQHFQVHCACDAVDMPHHATKLDINH